MARTYEEQLQEQIEQYRDTEEMHDLPEVFHRWSADYVGPGLRAVFGVSDINGFYVEAFLAAARQQEGAPVFLSLGCGDGAVEIGIARTLVERGVERFRFVCFDLSDVLLERFRAAMPAGLADRFELVSGDLNAASFETILGQDVTRGRFDAIMANHSLHHIVDLEGVFRTAYDNLAEHGIFVTGDMIGRNGHMRWPEARLFVEFFWPFLSQRQRRNVLLRRDERRFADHDCSTEGFEGVRAEEVLPLLLRQGFEPARFFGFGGMVDVFIDRCFGPNFSVEDADDVFIAGRIGFLNEVLLDAGLVKPTMMLAWFTKRAGQEVCYRGRTARSTVREVGRDPAWLATALTDFAKAPVDAEYVFGGRGGMAAMRAELREARREAAAAQEEAGRLQARVEGLERSNSWRLTGPLRGLVRLVRRGQAWAAVTRRQGWRVLAGWDR